MENSLAVANYFIKKALDEGSQVTPMKLLKLVYIAHGWNLALSGEPLLNEGVEAWKFGPVVPSVYHEFKEYGNTAIKRLANVYVSRNQVITPTIGKASKDLLDKVWEVYKKYDGLQLSTLTHQKDTPWDIIWNKNGGRTEKGILIPNDLIEEHYKQKAEQSENYNKEATLV